MFEKEQKLDGKKKNTQYLCIAIGSRDRSLSVWLTSLKRPLFVIHDVFESSILDLAWSKDGMVLLACSMDGSVAAVVLNEEELGTPMSKESKSAMLKKVSDQNAMTTITSLTLVSFIHFFTFVRYTGRPSVSLQVLNQPS